MLNSNVKGYACHLSLCWASSNQSILSHPTSWRSILILSFLLHLGLPSGLFSSGFPIKTLYKPLLSPLHATCLAQLILLNFINLNNIVWGVQIVNPQQYIDNYLSSDIFWCGDALCPIPERERERGGGGERERETLLHKGHDSKEGEVRFNNQSSFSGVHECNVLSLCGRKNRQNLWFH